MIESGFINGDCMDYLKEYPDNYFDLCIADPPYGDAMKSGGVEQIRSEVLKCIPFKKVIMQRTSFSIACNVGLGTVGIAYYTRQ